MSKAKEFYDAAEKKIVINWIQVTCSILLQNIVLTYCEKKIVLVIKKNYSN